MRITAMRVLPAGDRTGELARFDIAYGQDLTIHDVILRRTQNGDLRIYSPISTRRQRAVTFNLTRVESIIADAFAAYQSMASGVTDAAA